MFCGLSFHLYLYNLLLFFVIYYSLQSIIVFYSLFWVFIVYYCFYNLFWSFMAYYCFFYKLLLFLQSIIIFYNLLWGFFCSPLAVLPDKLLVDIGGKNFPKRVVGFGDIYIFTFARFFENIYCVKVV